VGGLIEVAGEADLVGFGGLELGRVQDIGSDGRIRVLASRTMAGFAGPGSPAVLISDVHLFMRVLLKGIEELLMAQLAGLGADVLLWLRVGGRGSGGGSGGGRLTLGAPYGGSGE
jgi:hypothetical protein